MALAVGATVAGGPASYRVLDIAVGALSISLVPLLSRWPVPVMAALSLLAAVSPAATPPATMAAPIVAECEPFGIALSLAGTGIAAHLIRGAWRPIPGLPYPWYATLVLVAYAALIGWGTLMRAHRALISSLRERAERAEADQARRVAQARAAERATIAREMHDVLAHRLSLLATYAGALAYRPDAPPEQLSRAAEVVRSGAHQALEELREVIGVLRDDPGAATDLTAGRAPLPGLADLPELIGESRAAGTRVCVSGAAWPADGWPAGLPDATGRTVYRVVQEGLTNARKHAPGEPVQVTFGGGPGAGLDVSIANQVGQATPAASLPGTGTGLIGLTERLELAGGTLRWQRSGSEFRLHAWLPWPATQDAGPPAPGAGLPAAAAPRARVPG